MTDNRPVLELLRSGEGETLGFKEQWNEAALETLAGFANSRGGTLMVGVDDKGQIAGWSGREDDFRAISNQIEITFLKDPYTEERLREMGLNERQLQAVRWLKQRGKITNTDYQQLCRVKKRQASEDIRALEKMGVLQRVGTTGKGTHYVLKGHETGERGTKGAPKGRKGLSNSPAKPAEGSHA